jgi:Ca-activated chloride channel family protein
VLFQLDVRHSCLRHPLRVALLLGAWVLAGGAAARAQTVRIATRPTGLVAGRFQVPVQATPPVERLELFVNGVRRATAPGRELTVPLEVGYYIRRLRVRAVGYDAAGNAVGEDEIVLNDPQPPFRVRLQASTPGWPPAGAAGLAATVLAPPEMRIDEVDFFVGEDPVGVDREPPFAVTVDADRFPGAAYARAVARAANGSEANDVLFFGELAHATADVTMQQIPLSVVDGDAPLRAQELRVDDDGRPRPVEGLVPATDQPLSVILLIDYSESMIEELPVVKAAAREFAQKLLRPQDRIAVVGFNQRTFWLAGYTSDAEVVGRAVERLKPMGQTHLYDSVVEMLYEIQKAPGRHALVVFTDGADQGSRFQLDHLVHYARYAGVPIYPVIKNRSLSRWMRLGVGKLAARRVAHLADDTGATWFIIQKESELPGVYGRIARELRQQYQLVFAAEADMPDQWRSLRVVSTEGRKLRAPMGYFP